MTLGDVEPGRLQPQGLRNESSLHPEASFAEEVSKSEDEVAETTRRLTLTDILLVMPLCQKKSFLSLTSLITNSLTLVVTNRKVLIDQRSSAAYITF
jgi:hypothetical protein